MIKQLGHLFLYECFKRVVVFIKPLEARLVNVSHFVVFDQRDEEPKGDFFSAVLHQSIYDVVHALNIPNRVVIL